MSEFWEAALQADKRHDYSAAEKYWSAAFEQAIRENLSFPQYAYACERLMIYYRRQKRYDKEIKMCQYCIDNDYVESRLNVYRRRLEKAQELYKRQINGNKR